MKKYIIYILTLIPAFTFTNCHDLLNESYTRDPVADVYYNTPEGFEDAVRASYPYLRNYYGKISGLELNVLGTDLWQNSSDGNNKGFNNYDSDIQPSKDILWTLWSNFYQGIAACNTVIDRADQVQGMPLEEVNKLVGEALFLRAHYYYILVMHFGGIPLKINEVISVETTAIRATEKEVYNQILLDLEQAELFLPVTSSEHGRAIKPAAQALLSKVHLTLKNWDESKTYADKVINDYTFSLLENFGDLWLEDNDINNEVIWSIQYTKDIRLNGSGNEGLWGFGMKYDILPGMRRTIEYGRPFARFMPSRYFMDLLSSTRDIDSRYDNSWREVWYANNPSGLPSGISLGDTALFVTSKAVSPQEKKSRKAKYFFRDVNDYYNGENYVGNRQRFPVLIKYKDTSVPTINNPGARDWFVFRLAEMYLIAAEALIMQNKNAEAVPYVNAIRERAAITGKEEEMRVTAEQLDIDFILDERAFEFCGEMMRWIDLKRTGKLIERVQLHNPDGRDNIQSFHLLRPIPTQQMDRITNKNEFLQNPGY
jgi:hypothetical protein